MTRLACWCSAVKTRRSPNDADWATIFRFASPSNDGSWVLRKGSNLARTYVLAAAGFVSVSELNQSTRIGRVTIARLLEKRATLNRMLATRILLAKRKRRGARPFL